LRDFLEWTFPLYLTSLKVQGEASPLPVADDDLELLGYPFDGVKFAAYRHLLIDVETDNIMQPSMAICLQKYKKTRKTRNRFNIIAHCKSTT